MAKPYGLTLSVFPLAYEGGHEESGTPQLHFRIEDGALLLTVYGPKGKMRLHCQFRDTDILTLISWLGMASREVWGMEKKAT